MTDKQTIQSYINNYRRHFAKFLKPGIGMQCIVYQADQGGAVLEFSMSETSSSSDDFHTGYATVAHAVLTIQQQAFGGDPNSLIFKGTNYILEPGRIILVKDNTPAEWTDEAARRDTSLLLNATQSRKR